MDSNPPSSGLANAAQSPPASVPPAQSTSTIPPATEAQLSGGYPPAVALAPRLESANSVERFVSRETMPLSDRPSGPVPQGEEFRASFNMGAVSAFSIAPRPGTPGYEDEPGLEPFLSRVYRRGLRSLAAVSLFSVLLSLADASYAQRAAADHPNWASLFLACSGLAWPTAILVGLATAALALVLHPDEAPRLSGMLLRLRPTDPRRRARLAVIALASPIAIAAWLLLVARASLTILGSPGSNAALGFTLAAFTVGLGLLFCAPVLALARYVGVRMRKSTPDPVRWAIWGTVLGALPIAVSIITGPTSGAGGAFAIWGVFKRPELDLRLPFMALVLGSAAYLGQAWARRVYSVVLIALALLPLALTYRAGAVGLSQRSVSLAIERGAPLSRASLGFWRKLSDRDHDGFSSYFGGGDCNDRDPKINPGADDVPRNGIDEDCSGRDAEPLLLAPGPKNPEEALVNARKSLPQDLNLIFLSIDTLRADVLENARNILPHLDALAKQAVVFEQAYAPASYTGKSVGPILIGKHSSETNRDFSHFNAFAKGKDVFVQQRMQTAGIRTISVQGYWYFYQPPYGFAQGFDVIDSSASTGTGYTEGDRTTTSERLADAVIAQLGDANNHRGRFYLWAHFTDPHVEYVPHNGFDFGTSSLERYYGEAAFVDHHVGRIIDWVKAQSFSNKTAIVVTSDHGEAFGEHGMIRHGFELWEPLVRVPFLVHIPSVQARRIHARRSIIDLVPTLLDLGNVPMPSGNGTDFLTGRSLLPEILGIEGADVARPLFIDMAKGPFNAERQAYINQDMKLVTSQGRPLGLFDVAKDPSEKNDLLDDSALRERYVSEYRAYKRKLRVVEVPGKGP